MTGSSLSPGTPSTLRSINDRVALSILLRARSMSRNELSLQADVSRPTASQMMRRLEEGGFVEATGLVSAGRGPNTTLYRVRLERTLGVAIDVQTHRILSSVVDAAGSAYPTANLPRQDGAGAVEEVRAAVTGACAAAQVGAGSVVAVSIGLQASVSRRTDQLILPNSLAGWPEDGARGVLERETGWSTTLSNDVNLAAAAERAGGSGRDTDSFALLWFGDGFGLAADIRGDAVLGARGAAGEIGTLRLPPSKVSDAEFYDDLFEPDELVRLGATLGLWEGPPRDLVEAVAQHPQSGIFFAHLAERIALVIPVITAILDPEAVILGGPLGAAGGLHLARLVTEQLRQNDETVPLVTSSTALEHPVLQGARALLHTEVRARLLDSAAAIPS